MEVRGLSSRGDSTLDYHVTPALKRWAITGRRARQEAGACVTQREICLTKKIVSARRRNQHARRVRYPNAERTSQRDVPTMDGRIVLPRIQLDDQLLVDHRLHLFAGRDAGNFAAQGIA